MKTMAILAASCAALMTCGSASTQAPVAGSYIANIYTESATGGSCLDYSGAQYGGK